MLFFALAFQLLENLLFAPAMGFLGRALEGRPVTDSTELVDKVIYTVQENLVVGDLPAGRYRLRIAYGGQSFEQEIDILPGLVQYFYFFGFDGFELRPPEPPGVEFTPSGD